MEMKTNKMMIKMVIWIDLNSNIRILRIKALESCLEILWDILAQTIHKIMKIIEIIECGNLIGPLEMLFPNGIEYYIFYFII